MWEVATVTTRMMADLHIATILHPGGANFASGIIPSTYPEASLSLETVGTYGKINHHQFIYPVSPWESELRCPKNDVFYRHSLRNVFLNLRESSKSRGSDAVKGPLWTFILHCHYHVLAGPISIPDIPILDILCLPFQPWRQEFLKKLLTRDRDQRPDVFWLHFLLNRNGMFPLMTWGLEFWSLLTWFMGFMGWISTF